MKKVIINIVLLYFIVIASCTNNSKQKEGFFDYTRTFDARGYTKEKIIYLCMDYYVLTNSTESDVGYVFPQVHVLNPNFDKEDNMSKLEFDKLDSFKPQFDSFALDKKAKVTDFLSHSGAIGGNGFIISERVRRIIEDSKLILPPFNIYSLEVIIKKNNFDKFFFLHVVTPTKNIIDFEKSKIYIQEMGSKVKDINIGSDEQVDAELKKLDDLERFSFEEITLAKEFPKFDLFWLGHFSVHAFISENFKVILEENKVTGVEIIGPVAIYL